MRGDLVGHLVDRLLIHDERHGGTNFADRLALARKQASPRSGVDDRFQREAWAIADDRNGDNRMGWIVGCREGRGDRLR
jgi:hypothetical protein